MLGPSGFFLPTGPGDTHSEANDIELIHTSKDGFNELYRVCKNGRFFVYKALKKEFRGNLLYEELLKKDFNIGFSLNHSGISQYYAKIDHPVIGNCIVMEWIDGCTLEELIKKETIDSRLALKILCETCDALEYIHRKQIIHRDLKPENILITYNGQNVKIIDFGLSDADSYGILKSPAGTRVYSSPELISGGTIDLRSDIWSLGIIINEVSGKYRHIAARCLRRERGRRYNSAEEVKTALLREGTRKVISSAFAIIVICIVAAVAATLLISLETEVEHVEYDNTQVRPPVDSTLPEPTPERVLPPKAKPVTKDFDVDELEKMFQDAAQTIL